MDKPCAVCHENPVTDDHPLVDMCEPCLLILEQNLTEFEELIHWMMDDNADNKPPPGWGFD